MAQEQSKRERRSSSRIKKINLVQLSRFDEEGARADLATGRTLDISAGGVRLELYHPVPLRSVVSVSVALDDELVEVSGVVVYLEVLDDERCAMGIAFKDVPEDILARIAEHVDNTPTV